MEKHTGTVRWFNLEKGYGFILSDKSKKDIFVHHSALKKANIHDLKENQKVQFVVVEVKGRYSAEELELA